MSRLHRNLLNVAKMVVVFGLAVAGFVLYHWTLREPTPAWSVVCSETDCYMTERGQRIRIGGGSLNLHAKDGRILAFDTWPLDDPLPGCP